MYAPPRSRYTPLPKQKMSHQNKNISHLKKYIMEYIVYGKEVADNTYWHLTGELLQISRDRNK